jgi:hypothetical protein
MATQLIPTGLDHLAWISISRGSSEEKFAADDSRYMTDLKILGTSLSILYQAGTCHRRCFGGPHILESLAGRSYNLACSGYFLIAAGLYDEALSLVRSIGEITNFVMLSVEDKDSLKRWLTSDDNQRRREFAPVKVRMLLEKTGFGGLMVADKDWYGALCAFVHVSPHGRPNMHNSQQKAFVGGVFQEEGAARALDALSSSAGTLAILICKYFQFEDLFAEITTLLKEGT